MKELKQIESQLRSWKPRPPSENLKARLFPKNRSLPVIPAFAFGRWLAPAMTLFILGMVYLGSNPQYLTQLDGSTPLVGTVQLSNLAASYAAANPSDRNVWSVTTFDSTNAGQSIPTIHPVLIKNVLMP